MTLSSSQRSGDLQHPLLVIDGDSLTHRAYHALPKTMKRAEGKPSNAIVGFTNFLMRLWQAEEPRAVLVGWDTLFVPTYRHELFEGYQAGREFDQALLEQLDIMPEVVQAFGFATAKGAGYEADDFLAAAVGQEEARGGTAVVATSDRDSFQLASERTMILQPIKGVSELARVGPADVRERYGVEPAQVPDFIALRGDPSDKLPGARGVGPKTAANLLDQYGTLEAMLEAGRFEAQAEELRMYRRMATLDASAPLPPLDDQIPDWAGASTFFRELGMNAHADRVAALASS
jgi:5'-3' exonuclease